MRVLGADAVATLGHRAAADALAAAVRDGLEPAAGPGRIGVGLANGELLLMPSQSRDAAGIKIVTVAPHNPSAGRPRIQGVYLLLDREGLGVEAVLDGGALTALRTPALSIAAVRAHLPERPIRLAVIGAGPQAAGHAAAFAAVHPVAEVVHLARGDRRDGPPTVQLGGPDAEAALAEADVIVCATSARTPVLDDAAVRDDAVVVAIGSHEPDARELPGALLGRSAVVVEDPATALREAGDVVLAVEEGHLDPSALLPLQRVLTGRAAPARDRPLVFKSVGMAWEDLVVARAVLRAVGP